VICICHCHPIIIFCFIKIQIGFTVLVPAYQVVLEKRPLNGCSSAQIEGTTTIPPCYIQVRAVVLECGEGQTDTQMAVATIHFDLAMPNAKCNDYLLSDDSELKVVSQQKEAEVSELKVKIDELQVTAGREAKSREELQLHYQQRLREKQAELDHYRRLDMMVFESSFLSASLNYSNLCMCQ